MEGVSKVKQITKKSFRSIMKLVATIHHFLFVFIFEYFYLHKSYVKCCFKDANHIVPSVNVIFVLYFSVSRCIHVQ